MCVVIAAMLRFLPDHHLIIIGSKDEENRGKKRKREKRPLQDEVTMIRITRLTDCSNSPYESLPLTSTEVPYNVPSGSTSKRSLSASVPMMFSSLLLIEEISVFFDPHCELV